MAVDQDSIFFQSEGDQWFKRNKSALESFDMGRDFPLRLMSLYNIVPRRVLEIGASNGYRVAAIQQKHGSEAVAVDASAEAVADGKSRFPKVRFLRGAAHDVPLKETFDLIIINFVFHWIGRDKLPKAVAEVDRLLSADGLLIIGDFFPDAPHQTPYHHLKDQPVFTYKQDYSQLFLASGHYRLAGLLTGHMDRRETTVDVSDRDRMGAWLLQKKSGRTV